MEKRAIIVDDEPATCELIEKVLSSAGIVSLTVTKSEEAPAILRQGEVSGGVFGFEIAVPGRAPPGPPRRGSRARRPAPLPPPPPPPRGPPRTAAGKDPP